MSHQDTLGRPCLLAMVPGSIKPVYRAEPGDQDQAWAPCIVRKSCTRDQWTKA